MALEQDSYFNVNKRNLIMFDDQMIDASKDKRIVNLFMRCVTTPKTVAKETTESLERSLILL